MHLPWDLRIVQHWREVHKPSNTARWLNTVVENSECWTYGAREKPFDPNRLTETDAEQFVLFPSDSSTVLTQKELENWTTVRSGRRAKVRIIVLDGSWRHAGRMANRIEGLRDLPHVALPPGPPSRWVTRRAFTPNRLCTFEAIVRLSSLANHRESAISLEAMFVALLKAQAAGRSSPRRPNISERG